MAAKKSKFAERFSKESGASRQVSYDIADASLLSRLVVAVSNCRGCAVLFGKTSDGGAWSLRFYEDGQGETDYCNSEDGLNDWLLNHVEWWEGYAEEQADKNASKTAK